MGWDGLRRGSGFGLGVVIRWFGRRFLRDLRVLLRSNLSVWNGISV
jgi:hypothetical protein